MPKTNQTTLIRRCKWCVSRIGQPRYVVYGNWTTVESVDDSFDFTDGICPDCHAKLMHDLNIFPRVALTTPES
jgi:hypothetical protein